MKSLRTEINVYTVVVYSFDMYSVRKLFIKLKHVDTIFVHNIKGKVFLHRIGGGGLLWRNDVKYQHFSLKNYTLHAVCALHYAVCALHSYSVNMFELFFF